jgi:RNA polymerase sigma factor (sigma-70 family)
MDVYGNIVVEGASYDHFFQENYQTLQRWALQITMYDRELSEDLLHDVYVRFIQREEQPKDVESVHGYLYVAMKNAYVTYLRRKTRTGSHQLSLLDHEFADNAALIVDPRSVIKVHDDLRAICQYACERKSTSISASVLILRFFHGYFSAEVSRVVNRSRNAVEARLLNARREAAAHLTGTEKTEKTRPPRKNGENESIKVRADLLFELRKQVFSAVTGHCLMPERLHLLYRKADGGLSREQLSHLVSCQICLDAVNTLLHMPLLKDRHPLDTLGMQSVVETLQCNSSFAAAGGT